MQNHRYILTTIALVVASGSLGWWLGKATELSSQTPLASRLPPSEPGIEPSSEGREARDRLAEMERLLLECRRTPKHCVEGPIEEPTREEEASDESGEDVGKWPEGYPLDFSPEHYRETLEKVSENVGIKISTIDCEAYPCIASIVGADSESFRLFKDAMKSTMGPVSDTSWEHTSVLEDGESVGVGVLVLAPKSGPEPAQEELRERVRGLILTEFEGLELPPPF